MIYANDVTLYVTVNNIAVILTNSMHVCLPTLLFCHINSNCQSAIKIVYSCVSAPTAILTRFILYLYSMLGDVKIVENDYAQYACTSNLLATNRP